MKSVFGSFHRLNRLTISNVFLVDGGAGDRWLIDTGHVLERWILLGELKRAGLRPGDLTGILLTHRHSDHAGNAAFFQTRFGVPVYAQRADAAVLDGSVLRPTMRATGQRNPIDHLFAAIENRWPAEHVRIARALDTGDTLGGLEVHAVPGHTEGSVFFRHDGTRTLFTGDMLLGAKPPLTILRGLFLPYPAFSMHLPTALASLADFHGAGIPYDNILPGHGRPIIGRAREQVLALLDHNGKTSVAAGAPAALRGK